MLSPEMADSLAALIGAAMPNADNRVQSPLVRKDWRGVLTGECDPTTTAKCQSGDTCTSPAQYIPHLAKEQQ